MSNRGQPRITDKDLTMPWSGRRIRAVEQPCTTCAKPFLSPASAPRKYCSTACYHGRARVQRECAECGKSFTPRPTSRAAKCCSAECASAAMRGPRVEHWKQQRMVTAKDHPIAPPSGVVAYARLVLYDKIGPGEHPCHWCDRPVTWKFGLAEGALVADHLNWDTNNDAPENLVPSCISCNAHRTGAGDRRLIEAEELTVLWGGSRTRAVQRQCETCGADFLTIPAVVKKGHGRFCSRACIWRPRKVV